MAMKYLPLYYDALEVYGKCTDAEFGALVRAALRFVIDGTEPQFEPDSRPDLFWCSIKSQALRDSTSYAESVAQGKAGAEKRWGKKKESAQPKRDPETAETVQDYIARIQKWKSDLDGAQDIKK